MTPIPLTPEIEVVARRIVWSEEPARAIGDPVRFMAYAMAYATHEDMEAIRKHVANSEFCEALDRAPPGIIDPRSWGLLGLKMGRYPALPMPKRRFGP